MLSIQLYILSPNIIIFNYIIMTKYTDHIKSVAKKEGITYKAAMSIAAASYTKGKTEKVARKIKSVKRKPGKQTKKDRMDESKGATGQGKGTKSKTKENYTTDES